MNIWKKSTSELSNYLIQHIPNFDADGKKRDALCFREKLDVYSKYDSQLNPNPVGTYSISVEKIGSKEEQFLVHIFSSVTHEDYSGGMRITSVADEDFNLLEEDRNEFVVSEKGKQEATLYLSRGAIGLQAKVTQKLFDTSTDASFYLPSQNAKFISNGCNIILTRYLALSNFNGSLTLDFVSTTGETVKCDYECFQAAPMDVNGSRVDAYFIRQKLYDNDRVLHENQSFLTKHGKILCFDWTDTPYMMKMNSFLDPSLCDENPILIPLRGIWKEDIELMSRYLDKTIHEIASNEEYLFSHPETIRLLGDYVKSLLCRKPDDVLAFTIEYFKTFGHQEYPKENEAFDPKTDGSIDTHNFVNCEREIHDSAESLTNTISSRYSEIDGTDYVVISWNNSDTLSPD